MTIVGVCAVIKLICERGFFDMERFIAMCICGFDSGGGAGFF
jgi:hypothetical protein